MLPDWLTFAASEAFVAVGSSIGLVSLFGKRFAADGRFARFLAANSFGVFVGRTRLCSSRSRSRSPSGKPPLVKHFTVAPVAIAASFGVAAVVRTTPPMARMLR